MMQTRLKALSDLVSQRSTGKDANEILHAVRALVTFVEERLKPTAPSTEDDRPSSTRTFRALDDIARGDGRLSSGHGPARSASSFSTGFRFWSGSERAGACGRSAS